MKTVEEASLEHARYGVEHDRDKRLFKEGVEFAQRWIPVDEELPELSTFENFNVVIARFITDNGNILECTAVLIQTPPFCFEKKCYPKTWNVYPFSSYTLKNVTHWRPIEYK